MTSTTKSIKLPMVILGPGVLINPHLRTCTYNCPGLNSGQGQAVPASNGSHSSDDHAPKRCARAVMQSETALNREAKANRTIIWVFNLASKPCGGVAVEIGQRSVYLEATSTGGSYRPYYNPSLGQTADIQYPLLGLAQLNRCLGFSFRGKSKKGGFPNIKKTHPNGGFKASPNNARNGWSEGLSTQVRLPSADLPCSLEPPAAPEIPS